MKFNDIPQNFRKEIELYYNNKLKNKKYHNDNLVSINDIFFPENVKTEHQKLKLFSTEHINYMTSIFYLLDILHKFLLENNIIYTICWGNLLGYYREKGQILWDDDVDILLVDENGKKILLDLWENSGKERKIWDNNWLYKNIILNNNNIIICKMVHTSNWFKILFNNEVNKNEMNDIGGIDITFLNDKKKDGLGSCDYSILNNFKSNAINYPIVKYGPIYVRTLIEKPSIEILNNAYGKNWINKNHPSLNKSAVTCNFERIGMGNVMFKLASTFGIAKLRGATCYLGESTKHLDGFCGPFPPIKPDNMVSEYYIEESGAGLYTSEMIYKNLQHTNIRVGRYLQSYKYFSHCEADIKRMFTPSQIWQRSANNWFETRQIGEGDIKACIHIRRGDMMEEPQNMPSMSWFSKVISKLPFGTKIIIFSDDMAWVRMQPLFTGPNYIHAENNNKMLDFTLMTLCNYYILSRGTFGWWAAYLSQSKVKVFYKNEFVNTSLEKYFDSDYYPEEWEEINVTNAPRTQKHNTEMINITNEPFISVDDEYDLINWHRFSNLTDLSLDKIRKLCIKANKSMWNFHILNIK